MPALSKLLAALVLICPVGWSEWSDRFRPDDTVTVERIDDTPPVTTPPTTTASTTVPPTTPTPTTAAPTAPPTTTPPSTPLPTTPAPTTAPPSPPAGDVERANARSLQLLIDLRASQGLAPVSSDETMASFATNWSIEMTRTGFRHSTGPYAENIVWHSDDAMTPEEAAEQFHQMWVDSPGHYANVTNSRWTLVGVGLYRDASGWWGTHVFR